MINTAPTSPPREGSASRVGSGDSSPRQRTMACSLGDGAAFSLMVGLGETYLPAFALAVGMGPVASGLVSTVPLLAGGLLQLIAPRGAFLVRSLRLWVVACAVTQAASFLGLGLATARGLVAPWLLFVAAAVYWGAGMAAGPAWNDWIDAVLPRSGLADFLARRTRLTQLAAFVAFLVGGAALEAGARRSGSDAAGVIVVFVVLFCAAGACRLASAALLLCHDDAAPPPRPVRRPLRALVAPILSLKSAPSSRFLRFLLVAQVSTYVASPFFSPYMLAQLHFTYAQYAAIVSASYLSKILLYPYIAALVRRLTPSRALWLAGVAVAPMPLFWFWTPSLWVLCALQVAAGFAWGVFELASMLLMFQGIPPAERMPVLTIYNLMNALAVVAGSVVGGALLAALPPGTGYGVVFALSSAARLASVLVLGRQAATAQAVRGRLRRVYMRTVGLRAAPAAQVQPFLHNGERVGDGTRPPPSAADTPTPARLASDVA